MSITPEWLTAITTVCLFVATSIYVYFSYKLTQETIKLREVETSPFLSIKIEPYQHSHMLLLEIENIGKSPAYNVEIKFSDDNNEAFKDKKFTLPQTHINYLPIGQKLPKLLGELSELKNDIDIFEVNLKYESKDKRLFSETIRINYKYMIEISMLLNIPQNISKLDDIKKEISKLNQTMQNGLKK